ncbi:MAG: hypothetical protein CK424_06840 [Legionella sp.]|nr:MAG: hypothetical protein CK424_06840 [Legionella sp.]
MFRAVARLLKTDFILMQKLWLLGFSCWIGAAYAQQGSGVDNLFYHPVYIGAMGGYGSTTWEGLVPEVINQNSALSFSTPIEVNEGGGVWGLVLGYEFTPCFALEANYMKFPDAKIIFDEDSLFAFDHDDITHLDTQTQTASLSAKVMLVIPKTTIRVFSSAGIASVFRNDNVNEMHRISPTFGFGVNFLVTDRVLVEIGTNYTAGYGESEINPVEDFVPFLYSIFGKVAFRFG